MQKNIHPQWHHDTVVTCSCGNTFTTGSTEETITVDICSACHPYFTGEMKFVDRQGRVDKFNKKMQAAAKQKQQAQQKDQKEAKPQDNDNHRSYQEILREKQAELRQNKTETGATDSSKTETQK